MISFRVSGCRVVVCVVRVRVRPSDDAPRSHYLAAQPLVVLCPARVQHGLQPLHTVASGKVDRELRHAARYRLLH